MKWTKSHIYTLKESPADAEIPSHQLMVRSGMIRKLAPGIFTYGHLTLKAIRKFEQIVREELDKRGCVEILMPMVHPKEIWEESNRWQEMDGVGLLKFKNRNGHDFCLSPTHEEVITDYVRKDIKSYRDLPKNIYQFQSKFRDEIRPRFGLMRGREFIMKDAYSFDPDEASAKESYQLMHEAYTAIFHRLGADFRVVKADSGNMGGDLSQEFQILAQSGEDELLVSESGEFAANVEVAPVADDGTPSSAEELQKIEEFDTPGLRTIADLAKSTGLAEIELVKTMFFDASDGGEKIKPVTVLLRGSDEVNPIKIKNAFKLNNPPLLLNDQEVKELTGASPGSCGPVGLKTPIYVDQAVAKMRNFIVGANKDDKHLKNVNLERDFSVTEIGDYRVAKEGDPSPDGKGTLKSFRGIEVGHIFYLGQKYTKSMGAMFLDKNGKQQTLEMGCYGIGITRTVQAVIEQNHDKDGIIWPLSIAPFQVHICLLDPKDEEVSGVCERIYGELQSSGIECLVDDRDERPGVKFKDADLLGFPLRLVIGGRGLSKGEIEWVERKSKDKKAVDPHQVVDQVKQWVEQQKENL